MWADDDVVREVMVSRWKEVEPPREGNLWAATRSLAVKSRGRKDF